MHALGTISGWSRDDQMQQIVIKTVGCSALAAVCGYGGTFFFFSSLNPASAAIYLGTVALTSQIVYRILENIKNWVQSPTLKHSIIAIQLLQIPVLFYYFPAPLGFVLSGAEKLEMVMATAHFVAIPVFFHLGIIAWNDPTVTNIAAAIGVLLPLANGLGNYAKAFR